MSSVLFVCLGNIIRSPTAEAMLRQRIEQDYPDLKITIDSCGLGNWHVGSLPDERMRLAAKGRGLTLVTRAKQIDPSFIKQFDIILAADNKILNELYKIASSPEHKSKIHLMTHFSSLYPNHEVPDPYYEGDAGFERVLDMLEDCCQGLIEYLKNPGSK